MKKSSKKSGEALLRALTVADFCGIVGIPCPPALDSARKLGTVRGSPLVAMPGDLMLATFADEEKEHCEQALEKGVQAVFVREGTKQAHFAANPLVIATADPTALFTAFLAYVVDLFPAKRIAVTGSLGKTTTVDLLKLVIGDAFRLHSHHSMTNSRDGVLRVAQQLTDDAEIYLQEIGARQPLYVESTAKGFRPHACVITNVSASHIDLYQSIDSILHDKLSLERHLDEQGVIFMDIDDERLQGAPVTHKVISYALHNPNAGYRAARIRNEGQAKCFDIVCREGSFPAKLYALGDHNVRNALAAFAVGRWLRIAPKKIIASIAKYRPEGMRQNLTRLGAHTVLLDCFNANPVSVLGAVRALAEAGLGAGGRRIAILGNIDRLGEDAPALHRQLGAELARQSRCFDILYCFGENARHMYEAAKAGGVLQAYHTEDRAELHRWIAENVRPADITLYKSGQVTSALAKTVDAVYGSSYQNQAQYITKIPIESAQYRLCLTAGHLECGGGMGGMAECRLPAQAGGYALHRISANAFSRDTSLQKLNIPDSVVNIGYAAFYLCTALEEVHFPQNLRMIERSAFNGCTKLESLALPSGTIHIEKRAFCACKTLRRIDIPASVGFIGEEAFAKCPLLTIHGESGSCAEQYAKENRISFEAHLPRSF